MAGENNGLSRELDGNADTTASGREKQAQTEIDAQLAVNRMLAATQAMFATPGGTPPARIVTAPGGPGGYKFDPATIAQRITDWAQVLADVKADESQLRMAQSDVVPPSHDKPAAANAKAILDSVQAAIDQNIMMQNYAQRWLDALRKANGTYVEHDHEVSAGFPGSGSETDGHGLYS